MIMPAKGSGSVSGTASTRSRSKSNKMERGSEKVAYSMVASSDPQSASSGSAIRASSSQKRAGSSKPQSEVAYSMVASDKRSWADQCGSDGEDAPIDIIQKGKRL